MKRLSAVIASLALTGVLAAAAQAQPPAAPPTPQQQAEGLTNKMKTQLSLSPEQVEQINLQTMLKVDSLKACGGRKVVQIVVQIGQNLRLRNAGPGSAGAPRSPGPRCPSA